MFLPSLNTLLLKPTQRRPVSHQEKDTTKDLTAVLTHGTILLMGNSSWNHTSLHPRRSGPQFHVGTPVLDHAEPAEGAGPVRVRRVGETSDQGVVVEVAQSKKGFQPIWFRR